jgi:hypothetical protein
MATVAPVRGAIATTVSTVGAVVMVIIAAPTAAPVPASFRERPAKT